MKGSNVKTRARGFIGASVVIGILVGFPAVAWAATASYGFDATMLGNQRLPGNSAEDFTSPAVSAGRVISDTDGTACDSSYGIKLVRHRSYLPDEVVCRLDNGRACDPPATRTGLSWGEGRYHFDARVIKRQESAFGSGFVRAEWWLRRCP